MCSMIEVSLPPNQVIMHMQLVDAQNIAGTTSYHKEHGLVR
jgi:hypothetical protein